MRIKITFLVPECRIPINYNYFLSSFIYSKIASQNEHFASFLHKFGYGKRFKFFTFSQLFFEHKEVEGTCIHVFPGKGWWFIASPLVDFVRYLFSALMENPIVRLGSSEFIVQKVEVEKRLPDLEEYQFVMISPLVLSVPEDKYGKLVHTYLTPEDERFYEVFKKNLVRKYEIFYGETPKGDIEIIPDWDYIHSKGKITKRIKIKNSFVRAVVFPFKVKGTKKLIEIGYEAGFGEKNSMGFGMVALKGGSTGER
ncbi:CRISPR-associated endoribonuclease Cas6 [Thermotoga sp. KOL6]|uniref:CRISPR-associated endoribonuclease Cas6 n=1 Tax=Thermotoga sp. KOL6 TaxID=126741 RepID=UPI000C77AD37|nr:CRISPR-associated endoribonuclease Cas6 [Thermotoga sp. KOL6]PLV58063.1 CRISPR-associated protein Cas6 [Thermotoga sp. KOL6]